MIVTCKKEIPFRWIVFAVLPWAAFPLNVIVVGAAFVFSLKKFVENPAGLTFILSLPGLLAIIVAPLSSFLSDRIWTRYGRRKPFVVLAGVGMVLSLVIMPLVPNVWLLAASYVLYNVCEGLTAPRDPLIQEIVPPHERGRATGIMTWCQNFATVIFFLVVLGRFDDVQYFAGFSLRGETVIYWSAALLLLVPLVVIVLGVKEVDPQSPLQGQRLSLRNVAGGLLDRELWPVYLIVASYGLLNFYGGFGAFLNTLLYTDQWGYTKQEMGVNVAIGGVVNVFIIGVLTLFADRWPRMRAFQALVSLSLAWNVLYYCYVNFVLPDRRPTLVEIVVFGEGLSIISILLGLVYLPFTYDYVRRNKMGTFAAGAQIATRAVALVTLNGVGLFVWGYAVLFQPPAGEMARVILREPATAPDLVAGLRSVPWSYPQDGTRAPATALSATPWQADGVHVERGRAWEIRLRNRDSDQLATRRDELEQRRSPFLAEAKRLHDEAEVARGQGRDEPSRSAAQASLEQQAQADQLSPLIVEAESELARRAANVREQIVAALGSRLVSDGEQLLGAKVSVALVAEFATASRPEPRSVEKMVDDLRREFPAFVDLRPLKRDQGYGLAASALQEPGVEAKTLAGQLQAAVQRVAEKRAPGLFPPASEALALREERAITVDLQVVEQPVVTYISPITRAVNLVLAPFDAVQDPAYRLSAVARNLRDPGETNHVRVLRGPLERSISVTAIPGPGATRAASLADPLGEKLGRWLEGGAQPGLGPQARALVDRVELAAASQRLTVVHPVLAVAFAPLRYDYMSGYLWVFLMGLTGVALTVVFAALERRGVIRRRGIEEAQAS